MGKNNLAEQEGRVFFVWFFPALFFVVNPLRHRGGPMEFRGSPKLVTNVS